MKTLCAKSYRYLGQKDGWHVFECTKSGFDKEILWLSRARMIMEDGSSKFYDPICPQDKLKIWIATDSNDPSIQYYITKSYSDSISKSASVKPIRKVGRIPKRNVAGVN